MRSKTGVVVSTKMDKTIVVEVTTYKTHPLYKKQYPTTKKFKAHAPENNFNEGDEVTIYECRPLSKTKTWTTIKPEAEKASKDEKKVAKK